MKTIYTSNTGKPMLVDDEDFERLSQFVWTECNGVVVRVKMVNGKTAQIPASKEVMGNHNVIYDHKDRNFLNNQRLNLRPCSRSQNQCNRTKRKNTDSPYRGLFKSSRGNSWRARIAFEGVKCNLGSFPTQELAAAAYNEAAKKLHGEFACLNSI